MFPIRITTLLTDNRAVRLRNVQSVREKDNIYHIGSPYLRLYVLFWHELSDKEGLSKNSFLQGYGASPHILER